MSMLSIKDFVADNRRDRTLLVLLPGAYMTAQDFVDHDFIGAVRRRPWPVDIIAADTGMDSYLDNDVVDRLHEEIIAPARISGATTIWLAGVSLGAMGALLYARLHREMIAGLLLLSPFIGSRGIVAQVEQAGGIRKWKPREIDNSTVETRLFDWLQSHEAGDPSWPEIHLAFGTGDRFAAAHRLLADILPSNNVIIGSGGHDWATWGILWERLMAAAPFGTPAGAEI
ncbi:MAG: alpha/beta hydrolase [Rhodospirillales bacterium]|nr:alpha/beta hydrolase [Rhodospirillales bacterium]